MRRIRAYAILVATLFPHFPHALQTAEHVAAPQQLAPNPRIYANQHLRQTNTMMTRLHTVPMLGTASSGKESKAPILLDGPSNALAI